MKKILLAVLVAGIMCSGSIAFSETVPADELFAGIKAELEAAGLSDTEIENVKKPVLDMIASGAFESEVVGSLKSLRAEDLTGRVLSDCVHLISSRVKRGENVTTATEALLTIVSDGRQQGLEGKNLVNYIHKALLG